MSLKVSAANGRQESRPRFLDRWLFRTKLLLLPLAILMHHAALIRPHLTCPLHRFVATGIIPRKGHLYD